MSNYTQVSFENLSQQQQELLIAYLSELGYEGFEESENTLKAFIVESNYDKAELQNLATAFTLSFTEEIIPQQNWNAVWESNFQPVIVDDFAVVRANFHLPVSHVAHDIVITPKMSFGTGHHATTRMMMKQMREIDFQNKTVLDFGTGTGILAILAGKLGAKEIIAIDNDIWSIENAKENFQVNNCSAISLVQSDTARQDLKFDIVLANIVKQVILENMALMASQLKAGGILIVSGLLPDDETDIVNCAKESELIVDKKLHENGWISLKFLH